MTLLLSVVIPSYRRADLLADCLRSVTAFAPAGTQVIVVDDASAGGLVSATAHQFPGVEVVRLARRGGFCVAANAGIAAATAPAVELLNDDAAVTAGWADAALRHFTDPAVVAVAPLVYQHDRPGVIDSAGDEYDSGGFARKRGHGTRTVPPAGWVWGASATAGFYRRSALVAAGGFPADFGAYFEDVDLSHRLAKLGRVWFEPASVVTHRVSASYGRRPGWRTLELQSRNEERVFWRHVGRARLPRHLLVLAGKAARRAEEGTLTPWAIGRLRAWSGC
jgi:GT2 family glycosyltransferase